MGFMVFKKARHHLQALMSISANHPEIPAVDLNFAGSVCAPLVWVIRESDGTDRPKNGTVSFIDTGTALFAVTADHVVAECLADAALPGFVQSMLGGHGRMLNFRLEDRLIDRNMEIDLATLKVTREETASLGCTMLSGLQLFWPPPLPQEEYAVVFCGYPGKSRTLMRAREIMFGRVAMGTNVSSAHDSLISMLIERDQMYQCLGDGELVDNYDFGGISGGPLLALAERGGIRGWMAAGIILGGPNPGDDCSQDSINGLEIFRARPIHFVNEDGSLNLSRWHRNHF